MIGRVPGCQDEPDIHLEAVVAGLEWKEEGSIPAGPRDLDDRWLWNFDFHFSLIVSVEGQIRHDDRIQIPGIVNQIVEEKRAHTRTRFTHSSRVIPKR